MRAIIATDKSARVDTQIMSEEELVPPIEDSLNSSIEIEHLIQALKDFEDQLAPFEAELEELGL